MKKLFYLLFISFIAFGSCTKQEPIDVNVNVTQDSLYVDCNCSSNGTGSLLTDTNLTGHWQMTNVNTINGDLTYWNNGQVDLHFFADGTWQINGDSGQGGSPAYDGTYRIHSTCIDLGSKVMNYSIVNGVLTITAIPGQDTFWVLEWNGGAYFQNLASLNNFSDIIEINNLVKQ
jgi:hypothetical protein